MRHRLAVITAATQALAAQLAHKGRTLVRMSSQDELRENMRRLMTEAGETAYDLARRVDLASSTTQQVLAGKSRPRLDYIERFARAYGLDAWQMLAPGGTAAAEPATLDRELVEDVISEVQAAYGEAATPQLIAGFVSFYLGLPPSRAPRVTRRKELATSLRLAAWRDSARDLQ